MTAYVDDARIPATVGRTRGRWSHLTADTPDELHALADRIGMRRSWFQPRCKSPSGPTVDGVCAHFHYDLVDARRAAAIAAGATPIGIREMGALTSARRAAFRDGRRPGSWYLVTEIDAVGRPDPGDPACVGVYDTYEAAFEMADGLGPCDGKPHAVFDLVLRKVVA